MTRETAAALEHIGRRGTVDGAAAQLDRLQKEYVWAEKRLRELAHLD